MATCFLCGITFVPANPPLVGQLFPEGDYAVKTGWTIDLLCRRLHNDAVVTWVTTDGEMVYLIYHSGSEDELPENYELVGQDSNDFTLRITMAEETAIFHTCTVEYNALTEVSATAMLFKLGLLDLFNIVDDKIGDRSLIENKKHTYIRYVIFLRSAQPMYG